MSGILQTLIYGVSVVKDAYFNLVTLLLNTTSTNGAQNNTFLDSSTNNFTITRNGNTTQGTFTPFSQTGWSNYFNGSSNLVLSSNAVAATGVFTIEAWVYITTNTGTGSQGIYTQYTGADAGRMQFLFDDNDKKFKFAIANTTYPTTSAYSSVYNTWVHVVVSRDSSNNLTFYVNGTRDSVTAGVTGSLYTLNPTIGNRGGGGIPFYGYISNLRITNTSVYSGTSITVPITPLTAISGTTLLTCQDNRFLDNSSSPKTFTISGTPSVQAFEPFLPGSEYTTSVVGGSGYFDAGSDYLTAPSTSGQFGASDFTLEAWIYPIVRTNTQPCIYSNYSSYAAGSLALFAGHSAGTTTKYQVAINGATFPVIESTSTIVYNQWTHLAVVRSSGVITLYINGVANGTYSTSATLNGTSGTSWIGVSGDSLVNACFNGYISGLRSVVGTAVYTAAFTPPTAPLTAITNTKLLLSGTNAGIFDAAAKNVLETVGNAQVSTTQAKWGTTSMAFDGTGDYLLPSPTAATQLALGTGDFTIEMWFFVTTVAAAQVLIDFRPTSTDGVYPLIYISASGTSVILDVSAGTRITGTTTISTNTWYHLAVARSGTSTKMFVNGTQVGSTYTDTNNYLVGTNRPVVGSGGFTLGVNPLTGYIDELRVTKYARYTANFTAPTAAFPTQ